MSAPVLIIFKLCYPSFPPCIIYHPQSPIANQVLLVQLPFRYFSGTIMFSLKIFYCSKHCDIAAFKNEHWCIECILNYVIVNEINIQDMKIIMIALFVIEQKAFHKRKK